MTMEPSITTRSRTRTPSTSVGSPEARAERPRASPRRPSHRKAPPHRQMLGDVSREKITVDETTGRATGVPTRRRGGERDVLEDVDAVVLALGAKGMRGVVASSPALARRAPELSRAASLGGIDVVTTRIWLDRYVAVELTPTCCLHDGLRGAGGTFFMLDQLQKDHEVERVGGRGTQRVRPRVRFLQRRGGGVPVGRGYRRAAFG